MKALPSVSADISQMSTLPSKPELATFSDVHISTRKKNLFRKKKNCSADEVVPDGHKIHKNA